MVRWNEMLDIDNVLGAVGLCRSSRASGAGSFFFGLGVGLIAGGAAALLLTPVNGSEAREALLKAGEDLGKTVTDKYSQLMGQGESSTSSSYGSSGYTGTQTSGTTGYSSGSRIGGI